MTTAETSVPSIGCLAPDITPDCAGARMSHYAETIQFEELPK